jgi:hypothetical protein
MVSRPVWAHTSALGGGKALPVRDLVIIRSRQRWEEVSGAVLRSYHIAWWNLENHFDEENAVALGRRTDKVFPVDQERHCQLDSAAA